MLYCTYTVQAPADPTLHLEVSFGPWRVLLVRDRLDRSLKL
jgi:hypothetical protein